MGNNYFDWNILDHRWNNFKRWFEAMEAKKDKPFVLVSDLRRMIDVCDDLSDKMDKEVIKAFIGGE